MLVGSRRGALANNGKRLHTATENPGPPAVGRLNATVLPRKLLGGWSRGDAVARGHAKRIISKLDKVLPSWRINIAASTRSVYWNHALHAAARFATARGNFNPLATVGAYRRLEILRL